MGVVDFDVVSDLQWCVGGQVGGWCEVGVQVQVGGWCGGVEGLWIEMLQVYFGVFEWYVGKGCGDDVGMVFEFVVVGGECDVQFLQ